MFIGPPTGNNILVNGTNKKGSTGTYNNVKIQSGKTYRLRLVNPSIDAAIRVSLDGHPFKVIANDFVPVVPYNTNWVMVGIGQRYDVVFTANQSATASNFWFRAEAHAPCVSSNDGVGRAIFTYDGKAVADPTTQPLGDVPTTCNDPRTTPQIPKNVPKDTFRVQAQSLPVAFDNATVVANQSIVLWTVNGTSMIIDPAEPTLEYLAKKNNNFPENYNLITVPDSAKWTYWIIQQGAGQPFTLPHPIHLHGHDMYILGTGAGQFNVDQHLDSLEFTNPTRRDVFHLPTAGWLVIAYPTDNPGAWLMHCHIAFHVAMGLSVQFLERKSEIKLPAANSE